ncbi:dockerin type I domain-containing protein [Lacipirellula parvula]|uniref:Endonuclease/exonuclease/phosphatase domain-containing protein n=1 Tax=Lacipirellula parvula TaxID=2650471 RepID=A0A5K7XD12_9BACT|nr:dockerin type I domain-containing protein [Lacipirellula parvula]BBO30989.1 hypothetical protein PLANPX_0601 [Lacipirellula parvula]
MRRAGRLAKCVAALGAAMIYLCVASPATAQLRIVTYNTATGQNPGTQTARPETSIILQAIGAELKAGISKPIDVLLLQEQFSMQVTTQSFVDMLNGIYGAGVYARSTINGSTSDPQARAGRPGLVYNTQTVQLVSEIAFGNVGTNDGLDGNPAQQPRSTMRYQLRPIGYDSSADFYAYDSHYKSDTGTDNNNRRLVEAQAIRTNSDALGEGTHAIYVGDYNIQSSSQAMYQHLLSAGPGQAFDPINSPGSWTSNSNFTSIHTQSPSNSTQFSGQTIGGVDDRFDFQLMTGEMLDNEGLSYIPGTYRAFGNNGTHGCCNNSIADGTGAAPAVLDALTKASDHLPVVADYQLPAIMGVQVAAMPTTVTLGASISVGITISNIANVVAVNGADELDYTLSVSGDLFGGATGIDFAIGGGNVHQVGLNTATPGMKSGVITVSSSSQGAAHALQTFPVSFEVLAPFLAADFNEDGFVDGADLTTWKTSFGLASGATKATGDANLDGAVDGADYLTWQRQFNAAGSAAVSSTVPEPAAGVMLVAGFALLFQRRRSHR